MFRACPRCLFLVSGKGGDLFIACLNRILLAARGGELSIQAGHNAFFVWQAGRRAKSILGISGSGRAGGNSAFAKLSKTHIVLRPQERGQCVRETVQNA